MLFDDANLLYIYLLQIRMTDEYHTPKDLVNKQPLTIGLEVFKKDGGDVESCGSESFQRLGHTSSTDQDKVKIVYIYTMA